MPAIKGPFSGGLNFQIPDFKESNKGSIYPVRVKGILLDETHPRFKELGEWNDIIETLNEFYPQGYKDR